MRYVVAVWLWFASMVGGALAADFTLLPGDTTEIYSSSNKQGWLKIWANGPVKLRWIHEGEKREVNFTEGEIQITLPRKLDLQLEASNSGAFPVNISVDRKDAGDANAARTWENFWGTVAGGPKSEVNKAHKEVKRWIKKARKAFG